MKKRLVAFRVTEQVLKDMEKVIPLGRYRDKTDVFYDAMRQLFQKYGLISTNNTRNNYKGKRR